jgi:hypothetical protein
MANCLQWSSSGYSTSQSISYQVFYSTTYTVEECADLTNGYVFLSTSEYDELVFFADQSGQSYTATAGCYHYSNSINSGEYLVYWDDYISLENCSTGDATSVVMTPSAHTILEYTASLATSDSSSGTIDPVYDPLYFTTEDYQQLFMLGFALPMIVYLVAWAYQSVINFATKDND